MNRSASTFIAFNFSLFLLLTLLSLLLSLSLSLVLLFFPPSSAYRPPLPSPSSVTPFPSSTEAKDVAGPNLSSTALNADATSPPGVVDVVLVVLVGTGTMYGAIKDTTTRARAKAWGPLSPSTAKQVNNVAVGGEVGEEEAEEEGERLARALTSVHGGSKLWISRSSSEISDSSSFKPILWQRVLSANGPREGEASASMGVSAEAEPSGEEEETGADTSRYRTKDEGLAVSFNPLKLGIDRWGPNSFPYKFFSLDKFINLLSS
mmetsp:Transcript_32443/g.58935  ORF Transcript_32443/g.58935 Transcript_32443/m.58935 type:complete len:263 (-) Transcript_32443:709-1497(-)